MQIDLCLVAAMQKVPTEAVTEPRVDDVLAGAHSSFVRQLVNKLCSQLAANYGNVAVQRSCDFTSQPSSCRCTCVSSEAAGQQAVQPAGSKLWQAGTVDV